jgi:hypothetical protein
MLAHIILESSLGVRRGGSLFGSRGVIGISRLERCEDTVNMVLESPRLHTTTNLLSSCRIIILVIRLRSNRDGRQVVLAAEFDFHGRGGVFGIFRVVLAKGFEDAGVVVLGVALG